MFELGAHICVKRIGYTHHGIYIGSGRVVHYSGFHQAGKKGRIEVTALSEFCAGDHPELYYASHLVRGNAFPPSEIVRRALSRVGEDSYNLVFNNCEHFANWCTHGDDYSFQTAGTVDNNVRAGKLFQAGGLTLFDLVAPFKRLFKKPFDR